MIQHDWEILRIEGVSTVIEIAARRIAARFGMDAADLAQEARIMVCSPNGNLAECARAGETGRLRYRLEQDLVDKARVEVSRRNRNSSLDSRYAENDDGYVARPVSLATRVEVSDYNRTLVESLLPAVWDDSYCYTTRAENAPDADMPRGSANKATGNTVAAHIADIKIGWKKAPLSDDERRALLLSHGLDETPKAIARILDVPVTSVQNWLYRGVGKLVATLNGDRDDDALVAIPVSTALAA